MTDAFARGATRAMVADRLGTGSIRANRQVYDLTCRRERTTRIACSWLYGVHGGPLIGDARGTVETLLPAAPGSAPRYRYDYRGHLARRVSRSPLRYRNRAFHWRFTSSSHVAFLRRVALEFQRRADAAFTAWEDRSGATGSSIADDRPCTWALSEDRTISGTCAAAYDARTAGAQPRSCRVAADATWAQGEFVAEMLDTSDCDGAPG